MREIKHIPRVGEIEFSGDGAEIGSALILLFVDRLEDHGPAGEVNVDKYGLPLRFSITQIHFRSCSRSDSSFATTAPTSSPAVGMEPWSGLWSVTETPPAEPEPEINSAKRDLTRAASRGLPRPPVSFAASPDSAWLALTNKRLLAANTARKTNVLVPFIARLPEFSVRRFLMVDWLAAFFHSQ